VAGVPAPARGVSTCAGFSVGLGLTNECNLRCEHCYRPDATIDRLTIGDVRRVCDSLPVRSVNLGVGENGLHPEYRALLEELWRRGIVTTITSNGLSLQRLDDDGLRRFHGVELSLDFPNENEHDAFRGPGNWRTVMAMLDRCKRLGVRVGITTVMMSTNHLRLAELARLAARWGTYLRVNVYQPAHTDRFTLRYDQFWDGFARLLGAAALVATSERVLAGVLGLESVAPACGRSTVRVAPDRSVLPCTYWPSSRLTIDDLAARGSRILEEEDFVAARSTPAACAGCPCRGGCAGRRRLLGDDFSADPYCPHARGEEVRIDWQQTSSGDLPKISSACTTIVRGDPA
jgi:radical SAM protein with 4Fe4S-binding SPASM domain